MKFGLSESEYEFLTNNLIQPMKNLGARVFIFGSRATKKYSQFSDIDLLYSDPTKDILKASDIFKLLSAIEDSSFPYKIDLVKDTDLAASYRENVNIDKIEI